MGSELLLLRTDKQNLFTLKLLPNVSDKTEHFTPPPPPPQDGVCYTSAAFEDF